MLKDDAHIGQSHLYLLVWRGPDILLPERPNGGCVNKRTWRKDCFPNMEPVHLKCFITICNKALHIDRPVKHDVVPVWPNNAAFY